MRSREPPCETSINTCSAAAKSPPVSSVLHVSAYHEPRLHSLRMFRDPQHVSNMQPHAKQILVVLRRTINRSSERRSATNHGAQASSSLLLYLTNCILRRPSLIWRTARDDRDGPHDHCRDNDAPRKQIPLTIALTRNMHDRVIVLREHHFHILELLRRSLWYPRNASLGFENGSQVEAVSVGRCALLPTKITPSGETCSRW